MELIIITKEEFDSFKNEIIQEVSKLIQEEKDSDLSLWMRTKDVCSFLKISSSTLQSLRNAGKVPFKKLNGTLLYKRSEIEQMLKELAEEGRQ